MQFANGKLEDVGMSDTPECSPYFNEYQNTVMFPDLDKEVMPEVGDDYVHASMMLPCISQIVHSSVSTYKQD